MSQHVFVHKDLQPLRQQCAVFQHFRRVMRQLQNTMSSLCGTLYSMSTTKTHPSDANVFRMKLKIEAFLRCVFISKLFILLIKFRITTCVLSCHTECVYGPSLRTLPSSISYRFDLGIRWKYTRIWCTQIIRLFAPLTRAPTFITLTRIGTFAPYHHRIRTRATNWAMKKKTFRIESDVSTSTHANTHAQTHTNSPICELWWVFGGYVCNVVTWRVW